MRRERRQATAEARGGHPRPAPPGRRGRQADAAPPSHRRPAAGRRALLFAMSLSLTLRTERWPVAGSFTIARGSRTEVDVVVAELSDGTHTGRGECVPYRRYGETIEKVVAAIEAQGQPLAHGLDRAALQTLKLPGAARNALDCAF